jgi:hypothetical protein
VTGAGMSGTNALMATILDGKTSDWYIKVQQPFTLVSGKTYTISFMAKSNSGSRYMGVAMQQYGGSDTTYWYQGVNLTTTAQTFGPFTFTCNSNDSTNRLRFDIGGNGTTSQQVYIDKVIVSE